MQSQLTGGGLLIDIPCRFRQMVERRAHIGELGQFRTSKLAPRRQAAMSALLPNAAAKFAGRSVRFGPAIFLLGEEGQHGQRSRLSIAV